MTDLKKNDTVHYLKKKESFVTPSKNYFAVLFSFCVPPLTGLEDSSVKLFQSPMA